MNYYLKAWNNFANFEGRARRSEYWYFVLFNFLITMGLLIVGAIVMAILIESIGDGSPVVILPFIPLVLYAFAIFIPTLALMARRLHDTGKSGWLILIRFIPLGGIVLLVFFCMDSEIGPNQWGLNPKGIGNTEDIDQIGME